MQRGGRFLLVAFVSVAFVLLAAPLFAKVDSDTMTALAQWKPKQQPPTIAPPAGILTETGGFAPMAPLLRWSSYSAGGDRAAVLGSLPRRT